MNVANFGDGGGLGSNGFGEAFDFEEKDGGAVAREARVDEVFDDAERPAVEHFAGRRNDGAGGDVHDGFGGIIHRIENSEKRFDGFWPGGKLDGDFGDEGKRSFRPHQQAG